jgi:hypothetical protein
MSSPTHIDLLTALGDARPCDPAESVGPDMSKSPEAIALLERILATPPEPASAIGVPPTGRSRFGKVLVGAGTLGVAVALVAVMVFVGLPWNHQSPARSASGARTAGQPGPTSGSPTLELASVRLRLPAGYDVGPNDCALSPRPVDGFVAIPTELGSGPEAAAASRDGGCIVAMLVDAAETPDATPIRVGNHQGLIVSDPRSGTTYLDIPMPTVDRVRHLLIASTGLSQAELVRIVADGLHTTGGD